MTWPNLCKIPLFHFISGIYYRKIKFYICIVFWRLLVWAHCYWKIREHTPKSKVCQKTTSKCPNVDSKVSDVCFLLKRGCGFLFRVLRNPVFSTAFFGGFCCLKIKNTKPLFNTDTPKIFWPFVSGFLAQVEKCKKTNQH